MDEMGVNALRTAHYQQDQTVYDLADERGYLVWTEIPLVDTITDGATRSRANAAQQLREMIRQNYNHPSVVFWGIGNEQRIDDAADERPAQPRSPASSPPRTPTGSPPTRTHGAHQRRPDQARRRRRLQPLLRLVLRHAATQLGAVPGQPAQRRIRAGRIGGQRVRRRREHRAARGRPGPAGRRTSDWHPEEYQALFHEQHWAQIAARPYLWGTFVWNMFDFAADQRSRGRHARPQRQGPGDVRPRRPQGRVLLVQGELDGHAVRLPHQPAVGRAARRPDNGQGVRHAPGRGVDRERHAGRPGGVRGRRRVHVAASRWHRGRTRSR